MKRLSTPIRIVAPLVLLTISTITLILVFITPANAMLECPVMTDQMSTYSCGCNPPRLEGLEPAEILPKYCTSPCPLTNNNLQQQATTCACTTYCRVDDTTSPVSTDNTPSSPASTPAQTTPTLLTPAQLAACRKAAPKIDALVGTVLSREQGQLSLFTAVAHQAETFYSKNNAGAVNLSSLIASVNNNEQDAQAKIAALKVDAISKFDCSQADPKSTAGTKLSDAKTAVSALQSYRTAIKDMLAGIQSAEGSSR